MAGEYDWIAELIEEFGRDVTLVKGPTTLQDTDKPWRGKVKAPVDDGHGESVDGTEPTEVDGVAAIVSYKAREVDNDLVKTGDCRAYIVSDGLHDFTTFDVLEDADGGVWHIGSQCQKLQINTTDLAYILHLRR
jgi:hypothetical protein